MFASGGKKKGREGGKKVRKEKEIMKLKKKRMERNINKERKIKRKGLLSINCCIQKSVPKLNSLDFPSNLVVKNLPADSGDMGSVSSLGGSHML